MLTYEEHDLLAQVASMYYEQEMTQNEIAAELGFSRVKVYRLLKQARAEQVVQIIVHWPIKRNSGLERKLVDTFSLQEALVVRSMPETNSTTLRRVAQTGARYLERVLKEGMTLAVCIGRSTYEVIHAIRPGFQVGIDVAQAMGSIPFAIQEFDSGTLARELAQKLGGRVHYLSSPMMADSPEAAEVLRSQRSISRTLTAARQADVALLGIGNLELETSSLVKAGSVLPEELTTLVNAGAIGDIGGQIITRKGQLHTCEYNQRFVGLTLEELGAVPITIAVATGREIAKAILGALHTGVVKVLCTDDQTASEVLQQYQLELGSAQ